MFPYNATDGVADAHWHPAIFQGFSVSEDEVEMKNWTWSSLGSLNPETIMKVLGADNAALGLLLMVWDSIVAHPAYTTVMTVIIFLIYYYLYLPMNWKKELSQVGYQHLKPGKGVTKKEMISKLRQMKKIGSLPPIYPNGWFVIAEADDIPNGQVRYITALGEHFAVFRTLAGNIHILDAYCPHLGANMGVGGKVVGDCLTCPFHGWQFSGFDGKCTSVPYSEKVPHFAHVKKWKSIEVNDFIFVWYHAEGEDPTWFPEVYEPIMSRKYVYRGRNEFYVNSHIQDIPENGGDIAHFNTIHSAAMLTGSDLRFQEQPLFQFIRHHWKAEWTPSDEPNKKHIGKTSLSHHLTICGKIKLATVNVDIDQVGPGYVFLLMNTSFGPLVFTQAVTPVEPLVQRIVHRVYCPPLLSLYATFALIVESIMVERDIMVWNHKTYISKPLLVKEDKTLARHRRWYTQFYSPNSPTFSFQKQSMEW